ncbi:sialidase family protein [Streptomyces sp. M19]
MVTRDGRVVLVHVINAADATEDRIRRGEVSAADGRRVRVQHSDDEGTTWSAPREITDQVKRPEWRWYATTPGHAVRLVHGPTRAGSWCPPTTPPAVPPRRRRHRERVLRRARAAQRRRRRELADRVRGRQPRRVRQRQRDQRRRTPQRRAVLHHPYRRHRPGTRADARSEDGGATLATPSARRPDSWAPSSRAACCTSGTSGTSGTSDPRVPGHLGAPDVLLFSGPAAPGQRALMTVRSSRDGGVTWRPAHTVDGLPAAYSDLVGIDTATVGLLYETGDFSAYSTITFRRIPVEELV